MADFRRFCGLAQLMLLICPSGVHPRSGRPEMDKFEAIAFSVGFIATGFLALVASSVPLA